MRVAVALHGTDLPRVFETYDLLSRGFYTHATPTLMNAGKARMPMASCFLLEADCINNQRMFDGLRDVADVFMADGGVGLSLHRVPAKRFVAVQYLLTLLIAWHRADRTPPQGGVLPYMRLVDATTKLATLSSDGRASAATLYLPIWHADVLDFIEAKSNRGHEEFRTRNIFTALVVPDLLYVDPLSRNDRRL